MSKSIFTKIINRQIPAAIVYEDDAFIAFMDAFPQMKGHMLVCPKKEVDSLFDLDNDTYQKLWKTVKQLEPALKKATNATRICLVVEGYGVPHVHVHMLPTTQTLSDVGQACDIKDLESMAQSIRKVLTKF